MAIYKEVQLYFHRNFYMLFVRCYRHNWKGSIKQHTECFDL